MTDAFGTQVWADLKKDSLEIAFVINLNDGKMSSIHPDVGKVHSIKKVNGPVQWREN